MSRPIRIDDVDLQSLLQRPVAETPIELLAELLAKGAKPRAEWKAGLEIELLAFPRAEPRRAAGYEPLHDALVDLRDRFGFEPEHELGGHLVGLKGEGESISLEPGGQLEYATAPYATLRQLRRAVTELVGKLSQAAHAQGLALRALGHQPYEDRHTVPKMPKARYDLMRTYMSQRGPRALDMMHLTGSVQCTVDFADEANLIQKVRVAAKASPFISALCAASPFVGGRVSGRRTERYEIWRYTDDARSGIWPEMIDAEGLGYRRYVEHALLVPAMLFIRDGVFHVPEARPYAHYVREGFEGTPVTVADLLDHMTSLFPEVRVKSYVELRGADCLLPMEAVALAGLWRGLLDDEATLREAEDRLRGLDFAALKALQAAVAEVGLDAPSPVGSAREVVRWLAELAYARFERSAPDCAECLRPLVDRARRGRSPADDMLEVAEREGIEAALARWTLHPETSRAPASPPLP
jgi:glutamate--cysteine ligase